MPIKIVHPNSSRIKGEGADSEESERSDSRGNRRSLCRKRSRPPREQKGLPWRGPIGSQFGKCLLCSTINVSWSLEGRRSRQVPHLGPQDGVILTFGWLCLRSAHVTPFKTICWPLVSRTAKPFFGRNWKSTRSNRSPWQETHLLRIVGFCLVFGLISKANKRTNWLLPFGEKKGCSCLSRE